MVDGGPARKSPRTDRQNALSTAFAAKPFHDRRPATCHRLPLCRVSPRILRALLGSAVSRNVRDPDRFGGGRLADLRPDTRPVRSRSRRPVAVPASAVAGVGHRSRCRSFRPSVDHGWRRVPGSGLRPVAGLVDLARADISDARVRGTSALRHCTRVLRTGILGTRGKSGASGRFRQCRGLELIGLADGDHRRPGGRRPALRPVGRDGLLGCRGVHGSDGHPVLLHSQTAAAQRKRAGFGKDPVRRLRLHLARKSGARRDLARSFRRPARRSGRAAAGLRT